MPRPSRRFKRLRLEDPRSDSTSRPSGSNWRKLGSPLLHQALGRMVRSRNAGPARLAAERGTVDGQSGIATSNEFAKLVRRRPCRVFRGCGPGISRACVLETLIDRGQLRSARGTDAAAAAANASPDSSSIIRASWPMHALVLRPVTADAYLAEERRHRLDPLPAHRLRPRYSFEAVGLKTAT